MSKIFLFDVDGTLTPPRLPIVNSFKKFMFNWLIKNPSSYVVAGSDLKKVQEQLPEDLLNKFEGIFCCMGNEFYKNNKLIYKNEMVIPKEIINWLELRLDASVYPRSLRGKIHFEFRTGMLNFSIIGRDISQTVRNKYYNWDIISGERKKLVEEFNNLFLKKHNIEANIGGQISIDIQPSDMKKDQILKHLPLLTTVFFGDKCKKGEIDYPLYCICNKSYAVKSWKDVQKILKNIYN